MNTTVTVTVTVTIWSQSHVAHLTQAVIII